MIKSKVELDQLILTVKRIYENKDAIFEVPQSPYFDVNAEPTRDCRPLLNKEILERQIIDAYELIRDADLMDYHPNNRHDPVYGMAFQQGYEFAYNQLNKLNSYDKEQEGTSTTRK